jgi:hypothetical protein
MWIYLRCGSRWVLSSSLLHLAFPHLPSPRWHPRAAVDSTAPSLSPPIGGRWRRRIAGAAEDGGLPTHSCRCCHATSKGYSDSGTSITRHESCACHHGDMRSHNAHLHTPPRLPSNTHPHLQTSTPPHLHTPPRLPYTPTKISPPHPPIPTHNSYCHGADSVTLPLCWLLSFRDRLCPLRLPKVTHGLF